MKKSTGKIVFSVVALLVAVGLIAWRMDWFRPAPPPHSSTPHSDTSDTADTDTAK